jgi:hypothetical protein
MTIRQLYYTSCRQGKEGIQGFQVNAASPGLPDRHEDLGLRLSAYRPPPSTPVLPTPEQIERFPVAVGYRSCDDVAVLFHSRYLGTDFTGRQGNYFAHVLVLDAPEQDLGGMLPIEAWDSALWRWQPSQGTRLPLIEAIPPGPLADRERIRTHLLDGRLADFGVLLSAVQDGLAGRVGRVVVVAPDAVDVARALAAVTRSIPGTLAAAVSFTTFTSSPGDADVLVAGTTPDVEVTNSPYGDQIVVTLAGDGSGERRTSRYASVLGACWTRGVPAVGEVIALSARVAPPLAAAELDQFADLVELAVLGSSSTACDPLPALEFALRRLPSVLTPDLWRGVDEQARRAGSFDEVQRWSSVLAAASNGGTAPGPELESGYVRAALSQIAAGALDPAGIWLPSREGGQRAKAATEWALGTLKACPALDTAASVLTTLSKLGVRLPDQELRWLADEVVLAALLDPNQPDSSTRLRQLPDADRLLALVCSQLESRVATNDLFDMVVEELPAAAAGLIESTAPRDSRCALAAALAHARATGSGRVAALLRAVQASAGPAPARPGKASPEAIERFAALLWPDPPTAQEGVELCRHFDLAVLSATKIPQWLLERLLEDARTARLTTSDEQLAAMLAAEPLAGTLANGVHTATCIRWGAYLNSSSRHSAKAGAAVEAIRCAAYADRAVAGAVLETVANWMLELTEPTQHAEVLIRVIQEAPSPDFLTVYSHRLAVVLASAKPIKIATVLPAIVFLANKDRTGQRLLATTCKDTLASRRKRELDAVGRFFESRRHRLPPPPFSQGRKPAKDWQSWWKDWRDHNLPQSVLARLLRRRTPGGDD